MNESNPNFFWRNGFFLRSRQKNCSFKMEAGNYWLLRNSHTVHSIRNVCSNCQSCSNVFKPFMCIIYRPMLRCLNKSCHVQCVRLWYCRLFFCNRRSEIYSIQAPVEYDNWIRFQFKIKCFNERARWAQRFWAPVSDLSYGLNSREQGRCCLAPV